MQETPIHEAMHGSEVEFQDVRTVFDGSAADLKSRRGSISGFEAAEEGVQRWRKRRRRRSVECIGFGFVAIVVVTVGRFAAGEKLLQRSKVER